MSAILAVIQAISKAISEIFAWLWQNRLISAGKAEATIEAVESRLDGLRRVNEARGKAERDAEEDIDRDDEFRRD